MELPNTDVDRFANAELATFNLSKFEINQTLALKSLSTELLEDWEELNSEEVRASRANYFEVSNTNASDYAEKILDLGS